MDRNKNEILFYWGADMKVPLYCKLPTPVSTQQIHSADSGNVLKLAFLNINQKHRAR